jgi:UDPglucose 6-dehydrogenase
MVSVYDPQANRSAAQVFPTLDFADSAVDACRDADLVLHLTEWPEFRSLAPEDLHGVVAQRRIFDGRNVLDLDAWRSAGWTARALGRR